MMLKRKNTRPEEMDTLDVPAVEEEKNNLISPITYTDPICMAKDGRINVTNQINYYSLVNDLYDGEYLYDSRQGEKMNLEIAKYIFSRRVNFVLGNTITSFKNAGLQLVNCDNDNYYWESKIYIPSELQHLMDLECMSSLSPKFMYRTDASKLDLAIAILTQLDSLVLINLTDNKTQEDLHKVYNLTMSILITAIDVLCNEANMLYTHVTMPY